MKLGDIRAGRKYRGANGEIRTVITMKQRHGGVIDLQWESERRSGGRSSVKGTSTPQLFARWADGFADEDQLQHSQNEHLEQPK